MSNIHENSFVVSKERGLVKISDVNVGESILCRNNKNEDSYTTILEKETNIFDNFEKYIMCNGTQLLSNGLLANTFLNNTYQISDKSILKNAIIPNKNYDIYDFDKSLSDIGWFLGMHTGDGTCDRKHIVSKLRDYYKYRLRILGDTESVIKKYSEIVNNITNSYTNYVISKKSIYKSVVWEYTINNKSVENIVNCYFDGNFGNKTYTGTVYSYIIKNNLWIPYLAGLMDSDGFVKSSGTIELSMCMKSVIDGLCSVLSNSGVRYHVTEKLSVRPNEKPLYRLCIFANEDITKEICKYMAHDEKIKTIQSKNPDRFFGKHGYEIDQDILYRINNTKFIDSKSIDYKNSHSLKSYIKYHNNCLGSAGLVHFKNIGIVSNDEYNEILRREPIKQISEITEPANFISLKTEAGNYYCGNFGLVNVQC